MPRLRGYCPGCDRDADPIRQLLVVRWCDQHAPPLDGPDDTTVSSTTDVEEAGDQVGCDNRRWCELLHGGARRSHDGELDVQADQSTRSLLVIRRGEAAVFAWWRARCDELSDTAVIWDRRIGERRTRVRDPAVE